MSLDSLITLNISLQTSAPAQAGFGVPLVLGNSQAIAPDLVRTYDIATALASMVTDGYSTTSLEYLAVSKIASQSPRPTQVKVGRRANPVTQAIVLTVPDAVEGKVYSVTLNGTTYSTTGDSTPTAAEIAGLLEDAITAAGITDLTATDNADGTFDLDMANGSMLAIEVSNVELDDQTTDANFAADIAAIVDVDADWYALYNTCQSSASITAAALWAETQKKIHGFTTGDSDVPASGSSDIVSTLQALNYTRTYAVYTNQPSQFQAAAWGGKQLPTDPGSTTWKFKQVAGASAPDLTATEKGRLDDKNCNYINEINGISYTTEGVMVGGQFIDVTRGTDWWGARLQERLFSLFLNNPKIPGTDAGINLIRAAIEAQNAEAIAAGVFADDPAPTVVMPTQASRSTADKAARSLTGVVVNATLAGAIHRVTINVNIGL